MSHLPADLILYDGVCVVCNEAMRWILEADDDARFHYAPLQGDLAARVFAEHTVPDGLDSIVYVRTRDGRTTLTWHSDALLDIAAQLHGPVRHLAWLRVVPAPIRNLAYRLFARVRYRVFGKYDTCRLPTESEAARMHA
jgi:predicted DCC family thiol-disulfide oxidoreductase YuxK